MLGPGFHVDRAVGWLLLAGEDCKVTEGPGSGLPWMSSRTHITDRGCWQEIPFPLQPLSPLLRKLSACSLDRRVGCRNPVSYRAGVDGVGIRGCKLVTATQSHPDGAHFPPHVKEQPSPSAEAGPQLRLSAHRYARLLGTCLSPFHPGLGPQLALQRSLSAGTVMGRVPALW